MPGSPPAAQVPLLVTNLRLHELHSASTSTHPPTVGSAQDRMLSTSTFPATAAVPAQATRDSADATELALPRRRTASAGPAEEPSPTSAACTTQQHLQQMPASAAVLPPAAAVGFKFQPADDAETSSYECAVGNASAPLSHVQRSASYAAATGVGAAAALDVLAEDDGLSTHSSEDAVEPFRFNPDVSALLPLCTPSGDGAEGAATSSSPAIACLRVSGDSSDTATATAQHGAQQQPPRCPEEVRVAVHAWISNVVPAVTI